MILREDSEKEIRAEVLKEERQISGQTLHNGPFWDLNILAMKYEKLYQKLINERLSFRIMEAFRDDVRRQLIEAQEALNSAYERGRRDGLNEAITEVRLRCPACQGTGIGTDERTAYVTHDMALDAGEPGLEGQVYAHEDATECEYCGQPISAIRPLLKKEVKDTPFKSPLCEKHWCNLEKEPTPTGDKYSCPACEAETFGFMCGKRAGIRAAIEIIDWDADRSVVANQCRNLIASLLKTVDGKDNV